LTLKKLRAFRLDQAEDSDADIEITWDPIECMDTRASCPVIDAKQIINSFATIVEKRRKNQRILESQLSEAEKSIDEHEKKIGDLKNALSTVIQILEQNKMETTMDIMALISQKLQRLVM